MTESGGLSKEERQRQAAAEIARRKVLDAYENTGKLKDEKKEDSKVLTRAEWQKYHSAWQDYYQKYYSEYYRDAARQYLAKEKLKSERKAAEEKAALEEVQKINHATNNNQNSDQDDIKSKLRKKIQSRASDAAVMARRRKKLIPILAGLAVVLVLLFLQYNRMIFAPIAAYVSPGDSPASEISAVDPTVSSGVSAESKLIIPKLNVETPVSFGIPLSEVDSAMTRGVAHYRINGANAFPGEIGNTVITGHSAGDIYNNNKYKFIFSGLERLETGDLIYVQYNSTRYTYRMIKSEVIEPSNVSALVYPTEKPILTLITCTPLGTSRYRLLITAEQISPSFESAPSSAPVVDSGDANLPSNSPSFLEGIWNSLTGN